METLTRSTEIAEAREIDTRIAAAWDAFWEVQNKLVAKSKTLRTYRQMSGSMWQKRTEEIAAQVEALGAEANTLRQAARDLDEELYTGWSRFFLVQHIHSNQNCSSFRPTTRVGWLPSVSGLTEDEAVAEYGATLCTKCFASAPVEKGTR